MSLDTTLPSCCVGIQRADLRFSDDGLKALITVEGIATQAYYDTWGVLTMGIGYTSSCGCLPANVNYKSTMCTRTALDIIYNGFADGGPLKTRYVDPVKAWMKANKVNCLPQRVFDAFVLVKYNCGSCLTTGKDKRAKDILETVKTAKWGKLASIINSPTYIASKQTKSVAAMLITGKFVQPTRPPIVKGASRCQPYFNSACPVACGADAWTKAKAAAVPKIIVVPGATKELQATCDRCIKALQVVKGRNGCKAGDKLTGQDPAVNDQNVQCLGWAWGDSP